MAESEFDDESRLRDLLLSELDEEERELLICVHRLGNGCAILGYMDEHPNELLTLDDLAFHIRESRRQLEPSVRELLALRLLRRKDLADMTFYGLAEAPAIRSHVHELFNWQRGWHTRLARIENMVSGQLAR